MTAVLVGVEVATSLAVGAWLAPPEALTVKAMVLLAEAPGLVKETVRPPVGAEAAILILTVAWVALLIVVELIVIPVPLNVAVAPFWILVPVNMTARLLTPWVPLSGLSPLNAAGVAGGGEGGVVAEGGGFLIKKKKVAPPL